MIAYKIKLTSWLLWIAVSILVMSGCIFWLREIMHTDTMFTYLSILGVVFATLFLPRFISHAKVEIGLSDNMISIKWLKQFLFHNRPDREILLKDIESYKYIRNNGIDLFKLTLKDGTKIKLWHFNVATNDDFTRFLFTFYEKISQQNTKITREKTIYENAYYYSITGFVILLLITTLLILYFNSSGRLSSIFIAIATASTLYGLIFLNKYFRYRRRYTKE